MNHWRCAIRVALGLTLAVLVLTAGRLPHASAQTEYAPISGEGTWWAGTFLESSLDEVQPAGLPVDFARSGSLAGRQRFLQGSIDFGLSDVPFQLNPNDGTLPEQPASGTYAYVPITADGIAFAYNLQIDGRVVTDLRLSGEAIARIFTGVATSWDDPVIVADNPGLAMPHRSIVPVVDGSVAGKTNHFTRWLASTEPSLWQAHCAAQGLGTVCGETGRFPAGPGMIKQAGDLGITSYLSQSYAEGSIGYAHYSTARAVGLPVAKVLNSAGFYTAPTPQNAAVALESASLDMEPSSDTYLTASYDGAYTSSDPRSYVLPSYVYAIVPTTLHGDFVAERGRTLGDFLSHVLCRGQTAAPANGYVPLPTALVSAALDQLGRIPGSDVTAVDLATCQNPTYAADGSNPFVDAAPDPAPCDRQGSSQCIAQTDLVVQQITSDRPAGALVLTQDCGADPTCTTDLGTGILSDDGTYFEATGSIRPVTVTDTRDVDSGWHVTIDLADSFTSGSDEFDARALGWVPQLVYSAPPAPDGYLSLPVAGEPISPNTSDALKDGTAVLFSAPGGSGLGVARARADFTLRIPVNASAGTYAAAFTLSLS
jgi:ABC-type phosphate transport system substrate-binding protein